MYDTAPCTAQVHDGKAGGGTYRVHVHRKSEDIWYEVQDLNVQDILPQVCISMGGCISKQGVCLCAWCVVRVCLCTRCRTSACRTSCSRSKDGCTMNYS